MKTALDRRCNLIMGSWCLFGKYSSVCGVCVGVCVGVCGVCVCVFGCGCVCVGLCGVCLGVGVFV